MNVRRQGGVLELAAVLAAATLLASVLTFPFVAQMTHVGRVDNFDGDFGIWNVSWVARTLIAGLRAGARLSFVTRREEVNGQPGGLFLDREGRLLGVMILDVAEGQIQGVSSIVNPDKLRHLGPLADLGAPLRERSAAD